MTVFNRLIRALTFWWHTRHVKPQDRCQMPVFFPDGTGFVLEMAGDAHRAFVWVELTLLLEDTPVALSRRLAMYHRLHWHVVVGEEIRPHHALAFTHPEACEEVLA